MKTQIEQMYINAIYNDTAPNVFADSVMELFGVDTKETRTSRQNRARWKYLSMVASILNEQGHTYEPTGLSYTVKFTKDILYTVYWQSVREVMYPEKKKQLNTLEFSNLVEMVMNVFAEIFDIHVNFPNFKDLIDEKTYNNLL